MARELTQQEVSNIRQLKSDHQYVQISFNDNGIGFEQEYAEQIFHLFKRLHGRSEYEGTGIGLALCMKIVQMHGGHIYAVSKPNEGATFNVILPVSETS
jgi:light-regulated signal transduction histidine kinase (bacteriophytochrome)